MSEQRSREAGTFSQLFARHRERFVRFARRLVGHKDGLDAEDCVQEASAEFVRQPRDYGGESHFVRMFRRFMVFSSRGRRRHERAEKRGGDRGPVQLPTASGADPRAEQTGPRTAAARQDLHASLLARLEQMKPEYQRVIELRLLQDLSWRDVASALELPSEDAARKKYDYAMKQLRERSQDLQTGGGVRRSELDDAG